MFLVLLLYIRMLVLSTKPIAIVCPVFRVGRREEAKNRNRIGDRVDPCSKPSSSDDDIA